MKKYLSGLLCILGLTNCSTSHVKKNIYQYNTSEYNQFVKEAKISLNEAKKIICDAIDNKILLDKNDRDFDENKHFPVSKDESLRHYLIYEDNYIFIDSSFPPTHAGSIFIKAGIYINIYTGELSQRPYNKKRHGVTIFIDDYIDIKCAN